MSKTIYDISLPLNENTVVYPGDPPFKSQFIFHTMQRDAFTLSTVYMNMHTGTHVDAPLHYINNGQTIGQLDLNYFIGECLVVDINTDATSILPHDLPMHQRLPERIILKTNRTDKTGNGIGASLELAEYLHGKGVKLIGTDSMSIGNEQNEDAVHQYMLSHGMIILENLYLKDTPEGYYELIALPLKLTDLEASPVRAILRTL